MKRRFVALSLATLVAVIGWFAFAFRPAQSKMSRLRSDVKQTEQQVATLEAQLKRLIALKQNASGLRDQALRLAAALPANPSVPSFIVQVQDAANASGIDFLTVAPSLPAVPVDTTTPTNTPAQTAPKTATEEGKAATTQAQPVTPLRSIAVQVNAEGAFFEIESFVLKLEHLSRAVKIDGLELSAGKDPGNLSASLKLQMFMLTPQAAAPTTATGGA